MKKLKGSEMKKLSGGVSAILDEGYDRFLLRGINDNGAYVTIILDKNLSDEDQLRRVIKNFGGILEDKDIVTTDNLKNYIKISLEQGDGDFFSL